MAKSKRKFKTEVQQLLDLVIHSLYSHKEIFLRELISNASDAIDRARFEALSDSAISEPEGGWKIKLLPNKEAGTLTLRDNGIGMTRDEMEANLGTIANSGTKAFMQQMQDMKDTPELIGQFGVGFYSAFMVADKVTVRSKRAGSDEAPQEWSSTGDGSYTLDDIEREQTGSDIILHLKEEELEYLEEWKLRQLIKQYSDYVAFPIVMDVTTKQSPTDEEGNAIPDSDEMVEITEEQTLNSMKAIWTRSKSEVSEEEYHAFYKSLSNDYTDPAETIHWRAEGAIEFSSLLYIPAKAPMDIHYDMEPKGVHLYVRRVFIMNDTKVMLPPYLRFMKGVVDSSDLPLNVSREILQEDKLLEKIQKNLVSKILGSLKTMQEKRREDYEAFWKELGKVLKEGMHLDFANREKLSNLLLFESTKDAAGTLTSLQEYVERMPEDQKAIYYLSGDDRVTLEQSPLLEAFRKKNLEVLLLTDPIDEWVMPALPTFAEKELKAIDQADVDLDSDEEKQEKEAQREEQEKTYADVLKKLEDSLVDQVKAVKLSDRLVDSACCLVADDDGMNPQMLRMMQQMGQEMPAPKRVLELNPDHAVMERLQQAQANDEKELIGQFGELLYAQAMIAEGEVPENPSRFTQLVSELMAR